MTHHLWRASGSLANHLNHGGVLGAVPLLIVQVCWLKVILSSYCQCLWVDVLLVNGRACIMFTGSLLDNMYTLIYTRCMACRLNNIMWQCTHDKCKYMTGKSLAKSGTVVKHQREGVVLKTTSNISGHLKSGAAPFYRSLVTSLHEPAYVLFYTIVTE